MVQHLWIQQTTFQICIAVYVFFPLIFSFVSYAHFTTGFSFLLTCRNSLHILDPNWGGGVKVVCFFSLVCSVQKFPGQEFTPQPLEEPLRWCWILNLRSQTGTPLNSTFFFFFRFYGLKCLSQSMPPLSLCVAFWCTQVWNFNAVKLILLKACTCYGLALRDTPSTLNHKVICFLLSVRKCFVMFKLELTSVYGVGARYPILFIPNERPVDSATMCQLYTFSYWF